MIRQFLSGFKIALSGFKLIRQQGIRRFVIIPFIINLLIFASAFWYFFNQIDIFMTWAIGWLPNWLDWISWLLWPLFLIVGLIIIYYTFTIVANFIAAPFNGILAEKTEIQLTDGIPPSSGRVLSTISAIKTAVLSEIKKLGYLIAWVIPLGILSFIPIINIVMPFIWFIFGAWMLSLEYMDYPMGNHGFNFSEQKQKLRQERALVLGFGSCIALMTIIPVLNFFAMPVAVTSATQLWTSKFSQMNSTR